MTLRRLLDWLHRIEDGLLVVVLSAMIVLAVAQVLLRNIWGSGIEWADPLLRMLLLWIALLGAMAATRDRNHIGIDVLSHFLPPRLKKTARSITYAFSAAICLILAWQGYRLVQMDYREAITAFASIPAWLCESIIPLGFAIIGCRFLLYSVSIVMNKDADGC
ncbi:MAG: TRAP transporter small permease [Methylomicrobium sp.]